MDNTELKHAILDALEAPGDVDVSHIGVIVEHGVVTLTGHVRSYADVARAEEIVRTVPGVHAIAEEIVVGVEPAQAHSDERIAADILKRFERHAHIPVQQLQVRVRDAWVTVGGYVEALEQRDAIAEVLARVPDVQGVINQVDVLPVMDALVVRSIIADCLHRQADIDAANIGIRVHDGVVTLICDVEHMDQIGIAREALRQIDGVADVVVEFTTGAH